MDTSHEDASEQDAEEQLGTAFQRLRMEEERLFIKLGTNPLSEDDEDEDDDYDPRKPFHRWNSPLTLEESDPENEGSESETTRPRRAVSLPPASSVVSAMKGAREKSGLPPRDPRRVSWAPDVYDPRPNSLTYIPKKKMVTRQLVKTSKKYGKGKQKGKNARSGGGLKEKKHHHKAGGRSDSYNDGSEDEEDDDFQSAESFSGGSSKKGKNWGKKGKNHPGTTRRFVYAEDD